MGSVYRTDNFDDAYYDSAGPAFRSAEADLVSGYAMAKPALTEMVGTDSALGGETAQPIPIEWLHSKNNWPKDAEDVLRKYMSKNDFYNYKKTDSVCVRRLNEISDELRSLFHTASWTKLQDENLKKKIKLKMHRIRKGETIDRLREWRKATDRLEGADLHEAIPYFEQFIRRVKA